MFSRAKLVSLAVEQSLAHKVEAPFAPSVRAVERQSFGIGSMNAIAHGGVPLGAITEMVGPASSGRTTAALCLLREFTTSGSVCAWVDVADAMHPASVAASGVDMDRLLWVRCRTASEVSRSVPVGTEPLLLNMTASSFHPTGGNSPHPRAEGRDMPQAIQKMLGAHGGLLDHQARRERRAIGTPGAPNRPLHGKAVDREEQVATDRLPRRRKEDMDLSAHCVEPRPRRALQVNAPLPKAMHASKPWAALDQALKATDLLLSNGGFAAIVLDLGSTPAEFAWRIPLATWFRYRAACERSQCVLVLLTQHPCARSSAGLVVRMQPGTMETDGPVMTGVRFQAEAERSRFPRPVVVPIHKPPQRERAGVWEGESRWA